jgi:uncharacterized membrane protein
MGAYRQRVAALLIAVLGTVCGAATSDAAVLPEPDQVVSGRLLLFGKPIPLPAGAWRIASSGFAEVAGTPPGPYGTIGNVLLVRAPNHVGPTTEPPPNPAFLLIRTNALPVRTGWGPPPECTDEHTTFRSEAEPRDLHSACSFVMVASARQIATLAGSMAIDAALPAWAEVTGFRVSDRQDVIELRYGVASPAFAPTDATPRESTTPETLNEQHRAVTERLGAWAQEARQIALAAMRDPADQVPPLSTPRVQGPPREAKPEDITTLRLGLYKLATYRGPVTAWNFALASVLAGDMWVGAMVALWQSCTHSAVYFVNEMAWEMPTMLPTLAFTAEAAASRSPFSHTATADLRSVQDQQRAPTPPPSFIVDGKQVPLPAGTWTTLAEDHSAAGITGVALAHIEGRELRGLVVIHGNARKTTDILGTSDECSRTDIYFATIRYDTPVDGFCSYGKPVVIETADVTDANNPLWTTARQRLVSAGVTLPPALMMVGVRARTRENFIDARYYFAPDPSMVAAGLTGEQLAAANLTSAPNLLARVIGLQTWVDLLQLPLERGVRGRLATADATLPWPWPTDVVQAALIHQAHAPLLSLRATGAIDDAELERQIMLADAELANREQQRWSLWMRSAYKVATYRAASYIDAIVVSGLITANAAQTVTYATINAVAQPIMAYVNEIGWAGSGVGRPPAPLSPVNFPDLGRDPGSR